MAAVIIFSDFGAPQNKLCFHCFLIYFPWSDGTRCHDLSVQFSCSVMSDSLRPYEPQHARLPCPSPTPGVHPNPCPLSRWCHPTISSSVVPFSSCPHSFPPSGLKLMSIESVIPSNHLILCCPLLLLHQGVKWVSSFQMSQLFASGGQSIGVSASTSVLPVNTQDWSPLVWTGFISLQSKGLSRVFSN